jgi:hypothetical protein
MTIHRSVFWLGTAALVSLLEPAVFGQVRNEMKGPLRVHPDNPRYFTDNTGRAIFLTGAHTWNNLQDNAVYPPVDYAEYLGFLQRYNHNFIRMWAWEQAGWDPWAVEHTIVEPAPFARTGPGKALDGKPRFDVTKFNEEYFQRMRSHVAAAQERGIYVSVMLFQGWSVEKKGQVGNPWQGNPFNKGNNINGIDGDLNGDGQGPEIHTLDAPVDILERQRAYVRQVVDTVNDLDNVLYEIGNEMHVGSIQWQYCMIDYIRAYEKTRPKQHPIGMTGAPVANAALFASPADWISPTGKDGYNTDPSAAEGNQVIIADVDHVWPKQYRQWVWKSLTRGLNTAFMDLYGATKIGDKQIKDLRFVGDWVAQHETTRENMGYSRRYADRMDLAAMTPRGDLSSTGYCLAAPGKEYLIYQPGEGPFQVQLARNDTRFAVEWFDPKTGTAVEGRPVKAAEQATFNPPFSDDAVLYLKAQ